MVEISGIADSAAHSGGLWAHNDSGDSARAFGVSYDGADDGGVWELAGVDAQDWEDMAIGPGPDAGISYLFLADIGDNAAQRQEIEVHRVVEPGPWGSGGVIDEVDSFTLTYPDGPHNAESFLVDPQSGDWYVITKADDGVAQVFRTPAPDDPARTVVLEQVAAIDLTPYGSLATAADVSADGSLVAIRTYPLVLIYPRQPGEPLESAFDAEPCSPPTEPEAQGEAFTFVGNDGYITISEGSNPPVNVFTVPD